MAATKTETELAEKEKRDRAAVVSAERGEDTAGKPVLNAPQGEHNFEISENRYAQIAGTAAWRQDVTEMAAAERDLEPRSLALWRGFGIEVGA
ncbi:hypothetical protein BBAD15_g8898 [Beauveria bassiana D1-5]|uniref:Uncharacterized protein n=1 Tax=Beauveria bassiana D1-5 TaxID=1245745 RepID=A0A0A2VYL3_BEABA|nr:hypothetical protein BBAD15_g8898 [Beauveria bassiana D1-5]